MTNIGKHGLVLAISGAHEGKIGYYDDDDWDEIKQTDVAIVYFDKIFDETDEYSIVPYDNLQNVDGNIESFELRKFIKENPKLTKELGVK